MNDDRLVGPEPIGPEHLVAGFRCGVDTLDTYLTGQALADQRAEKRRTYVFCDAERVVAYYTLAAGAVEASAATRRLAAGRGAQPIPVILLARLAVDCDWQGRGIGEAVLVEALARAAQAADVIGARAVLVHAVGAQAVGFYTRYGFEPSPTDPLHLVLLMKDIRKTLG